jgi:ribosomal protein L11 methyltransferase
MLQELIVVVPGPKADALYDAFSEAGACALLLEDAGAGTDEETPIFGEPGSADDGEPRYWPRCRITATFDTNSNHVRNALHLVEGLSYEIRDVEDRDWVRQTQSQFEPIEVTPTLWIVPSWHREHTLPRLPAGSVVIELDPGLAFGTGSHPTTRMCLQWLAEHVPSMHGVSVLDYGCGSGILAIAAAKLGAGRIEGTDIDPQAVQSSMDNAQANSCPQIRFGLPEEITDRAQIVVANILANPLRVLASMLAQRSTGHLVLAGILSRQADEIAEVYRPWIDLSVWREQDGWVCMTGQVRG